MSMNEKVDDVLIGLHFRRILQWFLSPVPLGALMLFLGCVYVVCSDSTLYIVSAAAVGTESDVYEYCGEVLCNVTQVR